MAVEVQAVTTSEASATGGRLEIEQREQPRKKAYGMARHRGSRMRATPSVELRSCRLFRSRVRTIHIMSDPGGGKDDGSSIVAEVVE